jgi:hypothetical protein
MDLRIPAFVLAVSLATSIIAVPSALAEKGPAGEKGEQANAEYAAEVLVLHATNEKKGIDPRIGDMPELRKPPFSSYDSYELLQRARLPLKKGKPRELELPNKRILKTDLKEILPADIVRLAASINNPQGGDFLPLLEVKAKVGQAFILAGQSHKGGILVLVIRVIR